MKRPVRVQERIPGSYRNVPPILRLEFDEVVRAPLQELRVEIDGGFLGQQVKADLGGLWVDESGVRIPVRWEAAKHPAWFPTMVGNLEITDGGRGLIDLQLKGRTRFRWVCSERSSTAWLAMALPSARSSATCIRSPVGSRASSPSTGPRARSATRNRRRAP